MNQSEVINDSNLKNNNLSFMTKDASQSFNLKQSKQFNKSKEFRISPSKSLYYDHIPMPKEKPHWSMSAATLRHTSRSCQFSKSQRFPHNKCNYIDSQKLQIKSMLGTRSTSFGFGNRVKIPEALGQKKFRQTQNCPFYSSDINSIQRCASANFLNKGKTFGIGWKNYQAVRAPHRQNVSSSYQVKSNPGPNRYDIDLRDKSQYNKIGIHHRLQMFTTLNASYKLAQPNPQSYDLKEALVSKGKYSKGFGFGNRADFTKQIRNNPGPVYNLSGFCDKFTHLKVKLNQT